LAFQEPREFQGVEKGTGWFLEGMGGQQIITNSLAFPTDQADESVSHDLRDRFQSPGLYRKGRDGTGYTGLIE
jgi:hypothetical protein